LFKTRKERSWRYKLSTPNENEAGSTAMRLSAVNGWLSCSRLSQGLSLISDALSDGSLLLMTPINPRYLLLPLLVAYATTPSSSSASSSSRTIPRITLSQALKDERSDNFLPMDDLVDSLSRLPVGNEDNDEVDRNGDEDVAKFLGLPIVRQALLSLLETKCKCFWQRLYLDFTLRVLT
jgi:hypothetical protein